MNLFSKIPCQRSFAYLFFSAKGKLLLSVIDFFTGVGTGVVITCLFSADTMARTVTIVLGVVMIGIGWYREAKYDKRLFRYMNDEER